MGSRKKKKRYGIQRVDVTGKNPEIWSQMQPKLIEKIHSFIDELLSIQVDTDKGSTIRDEAAEIGSLAIEHVKARLKKANVQNKKDEAEISKFYAEAEAKYEEANKIRAETRIKNVEAQGKELKLSINKLVMALKLSKVTLCGSPGKEIVLFGKEIEQYITVLEETMDKLST